MTQELASDRRRVKQSDIALKAGVSISTVSRVLNNVPGIRADLRQQITAVAEELGYEFETPRPSKLEHVSLFTPLSTLGSARGQFHDGILTGIQAECKAHGIRLSYTMAASDCASVSARLEQNHIDGFLLLSVDDAPLIEKVLQHNVPIVLINAEHPFLLVDTFLPDNQIGPQVAVRYLIGRGHRRILHVTHLERLTIKRRLEGYKAALESADIPFDPALVLNIPEHLYSEQAYAAMKPFLAKKSPKFSAVFCANDLIAIGVLHALQESGRHVPEDVSLIGYDDIPMAAFLTPPLTTMRIEREELGALAVRRLVERAERPDASAIRLELATKLVERESVSDFNG
ncbi:MAG: LacI family DNA-binding transcriptional regulator [Trueperaceae bacterium]